MESVASLADAHNTAHALVPALGNATGQSGAAESARALAAPLAQSIARSRISSAPTLLPAHLAQLVTALSLAARVSLRASAVFIEAIVETLQRGTATGLGVTRRALIAAVGSARALHYILDKYTNLGIYLIHHTFTLAELFTMSGFYLTLNTIQTGFHAAEESVRMFDSILGSNESSRALSSIITLVRTELTREDPRFEKRGKKGTISSLTALTKALTAFACLQMATHRRTLRELKQRVVYDCTPKSGNFPHQHLVSNLQHFARYSSAAYGQSFLRIFGIAKHEFKFPHTEIHANNHAFAHHVGIHVEDILLSSFTDPGPTFATDKISQIVNYVAVDHSVKAVVLACRGSLGLADILTDLTCSYEPIPIPDGDPDGTYYVHSGMYCSSTTLQRGTVHDVIADALAKYPEYGLVLCGHSLGGGVASLLSILWSMPSTAFRQHVNGLGGTKRALDDFPPISTPFVTSLASGLPPGRPISCYTYGVPCVASPDLVAYCRGLVISTVHNYDIVPTLSLGVLRDFKSMAVGFYAEQGLCEEIVGRTHYHKLDSATDPADDNWLWSLRTTIRASSDNEKLYPPGDSLHPRREGRRVLLRAIDDVERRFSEPVFSRTMLSDHSPAAYEINCDLLAAAVM
ncbi:alpha/beta-hydrolase [Rhodotorula sp. JG-1b]|nr:alpha/beta-hydrolase [Rhodotorula sp. JG-1b]